ncbi:hypothetical protein V8C42DRAFT_312282 [Trichoderma barbatum]
MPVIGRLLQKEYPYYTMASTDSIQNPVFQALAIIQASTDKFPNPGDHSDFLKCRALITGGSRGCKNGCPKEGREKVEELLSEFKSMTECLETDGFYEKLEFFIAHTHCKSHQKAAAKAFREWKMRRTAASSPPSTSTSASSLASASPSPTPSTSPSPFSSSGNGFSTSLSEINDTISQISLSGRAICDEPVSDYESEPISDQGTIFRLPGLGAVVVSPKRASLIDHASVFDVITQHPNPKIMREGVVYILEHLKLPGLFKIGYSTKGAKEWLRLNKNCYANTNIFYESEENFQGAQQVERILQTWLRRYKITVTECEHCGHAHRDWIKAPRDLIRNTAMDIETFIKMPAYVEEKGDWSLCGEAYEMVRLMCNFETSALLKDGRAVQKENREAETVLEVIPEVPPLTVSEEADKHGTSGAKFWKIGKRLGKLVRDTQSEPKRSSEHSWWPSMTKWRGKRASRSQEKTPEPDAETQV